MLLKKFRWTQAVPGEAEDVLRERLEQLKEYYGDSIQDYVASLIAYDLWAEKDHKLTGPAFVPIIRKEDLPRLWAEVIRDFGKPNKTGSYFEHRIDEIIEERNNK